MATPDPYLMFGDVNAQQQSRRPDDVPTGLVAARWFVDSTHGLSSALTPLRRQLSIQACLNSTSTSATFLVMDDDRADLVIVQIALSASELDAPVEFSLIRRETVGKWHIAEFPLDDSILAKYADAIARVAADGVDARHNDGEIDPHPIGSVFANRYQIIAPLGHGGMGAVYRARDRTLQRDIALKVIRFGTESKIGRATDLKARFLTEARVVSALKHSNIVEIFDASEFDAIPYLVLELCKLGNLRNAIGNSATTNEQRVRWTLQIAEALAFAHSRGVIHRDIKPENVVFTSAGDAKLVDFGIAKGITPLAQVTQTTGLVGTPRYMAPEQLLAFPLDPRADQYAWGLVVYELWTGRNFARDTVFDSLDSARLEHDGVPRHLAQIVAKAVAMDRNSRFSNFDEIVRKLKGGNVATRSRRIPRLSWGVATIIFGALATAASAWALAHGNPAISVTPSSADIAFPKSPNVDAQHAFDEAMRTLLDASFGNCGEQFERAASLDPGFAMAHLYAFIVDPFPEEKAREHYRHALAQRDQLDAFHRDLLTAVEPNRRLPPSIPELSSNLSALAARYPQSAIPLVPLILARDYGTALRLANNMRGSAPDAAIARAVQARALWGVGRLDEARVAYEGCVSASPSATYCLDGLSWLAALTGDCRRSEEIAHRMIAAAPNWERAHRLLALAMYGGGASVSATRAVYDRVLEYDRPKRRPRDAAEFDFQFAILDGSFAAANTALDRWEQALHADPAEDGHAFREKYRMLLDMEVGDDASAASVARRFLQQRPALLQTATMGYPMWFESGRYLAGETSRDALVEARKTWAPRASAGDAESVAVWTAAYAMPIRTSTDAAEAIANAPAALAPHLVRPDDELFTGRAFLAGGDPQRALPFLEAIGKSCLALAFPVTHTLANLELGKAYEALGRDDAACGAYDLVIKRWGRMKGSRSAMEAQRRHASLRCQ